MFNQWIHEHAVEGEAAARCRTKENIPLKMVSLIFANPAPPHLPSCCTPHRDEVTILRTPSRLFFLKNLATGRLPAITSL